MEIDADAAAGTKEEFDMDSTSNKQDKGSVGLELPWYSAFDSVFLIHVLYFFKSAPTCSTVYDTVEVY